MPSVLVGSPYASGAQLIISGNPWSGTPNVLRYGLQLRYIGSGVCFIALSGFGPPLSGQGFMTVNSGCYALSGGAASGMCDGMPLYTGDKYFVEPAVLTGWGGTTSGVFNVLAFTDSAGSGGRLYFEPWFGFRG